MSKVYLTERTDADGVVWCDEVRASSWEEAEALAAAVGWTVVGVLVVRLGGAMVLDPVRFLEMMEGR